MLAAVPDTTLRLNLKMADKTCLSEGCPKAAVTRNLCRPHYMDWWRDRANKPELRPYDGVGLSHCIRGHEYTPENTRVEKSGVRQCVTCILERRWTSRDLGGEKKQYDLLHEFVNEAKTAPCTDCGVQYPSYVMDFDHRDPATKKLSISQARNISEAASEIPKCDLVCSNCHRERTWGPNARPFNGGRPRRNLPGEEVA